MREISLALSDTAVKNLKSTSKVTKHSDGAGLHLRLPPNGSKLWRMAYRFDGKQKLLSFGSYPAVSLSEARRKREDAKAMLAKGIDPSDVARQEKQQRRSDTENTFGAIAEELLQKLEKEGKAQTTLTKSAGCLAWRPSDLDHRPITKITAADILISLRKIEDKGNYETARRLRAEIGQVFRYAIATAKAENDPTFGLRGALVTPVVSHMAALTDKDDFAGLIRAVWNYQGSIETKAGLKLMALLYPRPGELRQAEWTEFDLDARIWTQPKERTKMRREHKKHLSDSAIEVLLELRRHTETAS